MNVKKQDNDILEYWQYSAMSLEQKYEYQLRELGLEVYKYERAKENLLNRDLWIHGAVSEIARLEVLLEQSEEPTE